jgi:hypothetical protein
VCPATGARARRCILELAGTLSLAMPRPQLCLDINCTLTPPAPPTTTRLDSTKQHAHGGNARRRVSVVSACFRRRSLPHQSHSHPHQSLEFALSALLPSLPLAAPCETQCAHAPPIHTPVHSTRQPGIRRVTDRALALALRHKNASMSCHAVAVLQSVLRNRRRGTPWPSFT